MPHPTGVKRPILFLYRLQLEEMFGEAYGEISKPHQLLTYIHFSLNSSIVKEEEARWQQWALLRYDSFTFSSGL